MRWTVLATLVLLALPTRAAEPPRIPAFDAQQQLDWTIANRVATRLTGSRSLDGADILVGSRLRTVTLRGVVADEAQRERALRLARRTRGVRSVRDELRIEAAEVERRRSERVADGELAARICSELTTGVFTEAEVAPDGPHGCRIEATDWSFNVDVDGGVATLDGTVDSLARLARAIDRLRRLPGIVGVASYVTTRETPPPPVGRRVDPDDARPTRTA